MNTADADSISNFPKIREFLSAIAPMLPAYRCGVFSFVALLHHGDKVILRARLDLTAYTPGPLKRSMSTANLWAGQTTFLLDPWGIENCIRSTVAGVHLPLVGEHLLRLLPQQVPHGQNYNAAYERMDQIPVEKLVISGANKHQILGSRAMEIEAEVAELGFDSLERLMRVYGLRGSDDTTFEIFPGPVALIRPGSELAECRARFCFSLAKGIQKDRLRVNSRSMEPSTDDVPLVISGSEIAWNEDGDHCIADWTFDLPSPSIIECRVLYAGRPQARIRLEDPNCLPNPWRMALKLATPDLTELEKLLMQPQKKQNREFEIAVSWLLQILGFGALHIGSMIKDTENPDDIALAPDGTVLVIECTIDVPDDDKLMKLISRSARMRELLRSTARDVTVIPVLATPLPAAELAGIRQKTEKHSILVLSRLELEHAIERSKFALNPNGLVQHWRQLPLMRLMSEGLSLD